MIGKPRPGRYRLHGLDSPEGGAVLAEQGLTRADLERALAELERTEATRIRSSSAATMTGYSGPPWRAGGRTCPMPVTSPFVPLLWLKILELLGRVPEGSTARSLEDGTLPE